MKKTINKEELIGKVFGLDTSPTSLIEVKVIGVDGDIVKVQYLSSYENGVTTFYSRTKQERIEELNIETFCKFANITIE